MINDISSGELDSNMLNTIAKLQVPYIMMHMQGTPKNMQESPNYKNIINELVSFFKSKIIILNTLGFSDIIIDPGFGFGKTIEDNYMILNNLEEFTRLGYPLLIGVSRKSMIQNVLKTNAQDSLNGTTILNTIALKKGAQILRVHDVLEARECIDIINFQEKSVQNINQKVS